MTISKATDLFTDYLAKTDNKSESKLYTLFLSILNDLHSLQLSEEQRTLIEEKLEALNLTNDVENKKKVYKQKLRLFTTFLKNELSLTSKRYYLAIGMSLGMCFGVAIGAAAFDSVSTGLIVGMLFGMAIGAAKDAKSKKEGRVLNTQSVYF